MLRSMRPGGYHQRIRMRRFRVDSTMNAIEIPPMEETQG
jgi:hypothetical protein